MVAASSGVPHQPTRLSRTYTDFSNCIDSLYIKLLPLSVVQVRQPAHSRQSRESYQSHFHRGQEQPHLCPNPEA